MGLGMGVGMGLLKSLNYLNTINKEKVFDTGHNQ